MKYPGLSRLRPGKLVRVADIAPEYPLMEDKDGSYFCWGNGSALAMFLGFMSDLPDTEQEYLKGFLHPHTFGASGIRWKCKVLFQERVVIVRHGQLRAFYPETVLIDRMNT